MLKQNQFSKTRRNSSLELVQRQLVSYSKYSKLEYSNYKKYISDHGFGIFMRMGAEMAAHPRSLSCGDLFLVWVCWDSSRCHRVCQTLCHISGWPNWWSAPHRSGTSASAHGKTSASPHGAVHTPGRTRHSHSPVPPWTGSTSAGRSGTSFLKFPAVATFEAFSSHPPLCCCRRGCHSVQKSEGQPRTTACAAAALYPWAHPEGLRWYWGWDHFPFFASACAIW